MNPNIDMIKFSERFKTCRTDKGYKANEFSESVGVSTRYLADIERGDSVPKLDTLILMANKLEISLDYLLQDSLVVGYKEQASQLQKLLDDLRPSDRERVLVTVKALIETFKK